MGTSSRDVHSGVIVCDLRVVFETGVPSSPSPPDIHACQHGCTPCVVNVVEEGMVVGRVGASTAHATAIAPFAHAVVNAPAPHASSAVKHPAVCCHWKNKGWCRYGASCKFWHPDHKRGIGGGLCRDPREVVATSLFASTQHAVPVDCRAIPACYPLTTLARPPAIAGLRF